MDKYMEHSSTAFEKGARDSCKLLKEKVFQELNWDFYDVKTRLSQCLRILGRRTFPGPEDKFSRYDDSYSRTPAPFLRQPLYSCELRRHGRVLQRSGLIVSTYPGHIRRSKVVSNPNYRNKSYVPNMKGH
jgi:hypothetical protein